jgi:hypothetical protein
LGKPGPWEFLARLFVGTSDMTQALHKSCLNLLQIGWKQFYDSENWIRAQGNASASGAKR